jgi:hypothetical protein
MCPWNNLEFKVIVRDINGDPVLGVMVTLDFSQCEGVNCAENTCPQPQPPLVIDPEACTVSAVDPDNDGEVTFKLRAGGVSASTRCVLVLANLIPLAEVELASPDLNGDLLVDDSDIEIISDMAVNDPTNLAGDLDCNEIVDAADVEIAETHLGHNCEGPVQVHASTWGLLKAIYR